MHRLLFVLSAGVLALGTSVAVAQTPMTLQFRPGRDATQPGTVTIQDMGNQVRVTLSMTSGGAGVQQPAHIHVGACPGVGAIAFPLNIVVDGRSETTVNTTAGVLLSRQHSINVHRSAAEVQVYTACVDIPLGSQVGARAGAAGAAGAAPVQVPRQLPRTGGAEAGLLALLGAGLAALGALVRRR